jgi:hypothetical protein
MQLLLIAVYFEVIGLDELSAGYKVAGNQNLRVSGNLELEASWKGPADATSCSIFLSYQCEDKP